MTVSSIYNSFPTPGHLPDSFSNPRHFPVFPRSHLISKSSTDLIPSFSWVCWELWHKLNWYWLLVQDTQRPFNNFFNWMTDDDKKSKLLQVVAQPLNPSVLLILVAAVADSFLMPTDMAAWADLLLYGSWEGPRQHGVTSFTILSHSVTCPLLTLLPSLSHALYLHLTKITLQISYLHQCLVSVKPK